MKIVNASDEGCAYQAVVIKAYQNQYLNPIKVFEGDMVILGQRDETWQGCLKNI